MSDDGFDLRKLALRPEDAQNPFGTTRRAPRRTRHPFVIVPLMWLEQLQSARCSIAATYRLALYLLRTHFKNGGRQVTLANIALANIGVSRGQKVRALEELARLGLIITERRSRKSPIVKLMFVD